MTLKKLQPVVEARIYGEDPTKGVIVRVHETDVSHGKIAHLAMYVENPGGLSGERRKEYIGIMLAKAFAEIEKLFEGCDSPTCPNCGGKNASR